MKLSRGCPSGFVQRLFADEHGRGSGLPFFRPVLLRARQAVNFSCALAARRCSASAARSCGFQVPPKKTSVAKAVFSVPPENAQLDLGSRCHLPLGAPQENRAEKRRFQSCIRIAFPSLASSATTHN